MRNSPTKVDIYEDPYQDLLSSIHRIRISSPKTESFRDVRSVDSLPQDMVSPDGQNERRSSRVGDLRSLTYDSLRKTSKSITRKRRQNPVVTEERLGDFAKRIEHHRTYNPTKLGYVPYQSILSQSKRHRASKSMSVSPVRVPVPVTAQVPVKRSSLPRTCKKCPTIKDKRVKSRISPIGGRRTHRQRR